MEMLLCEMLVLVNAFGVFLCACESLLCMCVYVPATYMALVTCHHVEKKPIEGTFL